MSIKRFIGVVLLCLSAVGCERQRCDVPSLPVYFDMNIAAMYPHFVPDNGYQAMRITERRYEYDRIGYAGLLIWIDMSGQYHAADLCCPHCLDPKQPLELDGILARCPVCGEEFDLLAGYALPQHGITRQALRHFGTSYNGTILSIRN